MPPKQAEFVAGTPVTFFYALQQAGGVFYGQIIWSDPSGVVARRIDRRLDQSGVAGGWVWWTDTLPAVDTTTGPWAVELRLNGIPAGRYSFAVKPRQ
jgi:hypothetical protein